MREIKMQPVPDGDLRSPSDKHELHITRGSMTNVVSLTDDELAALRAELAAYRPEVHNGHYGAPIPSGPITPDGWFPGHGGDRRTTGHRADCPRDCQGEGCARNPDYGAPKPFTFGGHENHPVYLHTTCGTIVDVDTSDTSDDSMWSAVLRGDCDCESGGEWRQVYIGAVAQNIAYGAPLCTPGRRIDHEHSVACGPMAGADAPPAVTYSTVRDILRDVQAEVDAFVVGTGTQTLPYVEVIRMIRRVAVARGTAL